VSTLLSRILLALLMFPAMGIVWFCGTHWLYKRTPYNLGDSVLFSGIATWACTATYWCLLWRRTVRWTWSRVIGTIASAGASAFGGLLIGWLLRDLGAGVSYFAGTSATMVVWLIATVLLWRETPEERAARLQALGGGGGIVCPACGYNLTGLTEPRCPECGARYTLDELLAAQPARVEATAAKELES
jgi:hypothetical protein